jgi:hypothetical protein
VKNKLRLGWDTKWKKKQKKMHRRIRYDKIREEESDDVIDTEKR